MWILKLERSLLKKLRVTTWVIGLGFFPFSAVVAQMTFTEVASEVGVQFHQEAETQVPIGGGAAWADFDNDGDDDLYVLQATGCNRLYRNQGNGTFVEMGNALGASNCTGISHGAAVADYDNDGDQDIYVTNHGQNRLYRNILTETGQVRFLDRTVASGMDNDGAVNSASAAWGDYDGDSDLDLVVVNHALVVPRPDPEDCKPDLLYRNEGNGVFVEIAGLLQIANSGRSRQPGCGLAVTWSDFDNDGDPDLMIINDFGELIVQNKLFRNDGESTGPGGWKFSDISKPSAFDYPMYGMGIAAGDIDLNGYFDYYMSDVGPNNLAYNTGQGTFSEIAATAGVMADDHEIWGASGLVGWGTLFLDVNGDGYEEAFVANGGAPQDKFPGMFGPDYENLNPIYAYLNQTDMTFLENHQAIGMTKEGYFQSLAMSDYDGDGDMDIHAGVLEGFNALYRNDTPQDFNWLKVKAVGTISNRDAIGSRVAVTAGGQRQIREVSGGSGYLTRQSLIVHFGLGNSNTIDEVQVVFPSGQSVVMTDVPANALLEVVEPLP